MNLIRKGQLYHLKELEKALATRKNDGPYLFGSQFTMADVCWVPILDRMEAARWWSEVDKKSFPRGNDLTLNRAGPNPTYSV